MSDWAHVGSYTHKVFDEPFKVEIEAELKETPSVYKKHRLPNEPEIPGKIKVWRVQDSGEDHGDVVFSDYAFNDSPDTEIIAEGFNTGKQYGSIGIGRHGNFLQWGYSAAPPQMTEAGKKLFINCICHIAKYDGKIPLVRRFGSYGGGREEILKLAKLVPGVHRFHSPKVQQRFISGPNGMDPNGLIEYYLDNYELLYPSEKVYLVDDELKELGLESNRKIETLETLIGLLKDEPKAQTARKLLDKYTEQNFEKPEQWQEWFDESRDRIYFTDFGGYKFMVVPKGYLEDP